MSIYPAPQEFDELRDCANKVLLTRPGCLILHASITNHENWKTRSCWFGGNAGLICEIVPTITHHAPLTAQRSALSARRSGLRPQVLRLFPNFAPLTATQLSLLSRVPGSASCLWRSIGLCLLSFTLPQSGYPLAKMSATPAEIRLQSHFSCRRQA